MQAVQLTGFPFPADAANVYRVPADGGSPGIFSSGFTKILDIAFGPDGSLYVLQISAAGGAPPARSPGSLIRVSPDGTTKTTIVAAGAGLVAPGGIAIDADGSIYVTNHSVEPNGVGTRPSYAYAGSGPQEQILWMSPQNVTLIPNCN